MNYTIYRDGQEFGPYTLADLQHYLSTGDVLPTDMARSEGMPGMLPVSEIVGTIPVPVMTTTTIVPAVEYPDPPNLHWGLVLLFGVLTLGFFNAAWGIVLSHWMRKVNPESKSVIYYWTYGIILVLIFFTSFTSAALHANLSAIAGLLQLGSIVMSLVARYSLRGCLEDHFNFAEPMGLQLSGVMTFFFGDIYFQYHLNDINRRKKLDRARL
jgi:hypothetical protein